MKSFGLMLVLVLSACALPIPFPYREHVVTGMYLGEASLAFLQKNRTSRDEVSKQLGPPIIWLEAQRIAVYGFARTPAKISVDEPLVEREAVLIAFDKSDKVVDWGHGKVPQKKSWKVTWLSAALDWGRSQGLELAQPAQTFVEIPVPPQRSVVYFFDRPPWCFDGGFIEVSRDSTLLGEVRCNSYLAVSLAPGAYDFRVSFYDGHARSSGIRSSSRHITLQPGLAYFLRIRQKTPATSPPIVVTVYQSREEAMPVLQALRETW